MATTAIIDLSKYVKKEDASSRIKTNTTLYLSPTGSDTTGDGTSTNPWFSIKRAVEYLKDYTIDGDVSVTIRGLPGVYNYNNTHKVTINHNNAEQIKILFDHNTSGYFGETTATGGYSRQKVRNRQWLVTFNVTNTTNISTGDYVRITSTITGHDSIFNGYFRVHATTSSTIQIEYYGYRKEDYITDPDDHYESPDFLYGPYEAISLIDTLHITKPATTIISTCTSGSLIFCPNGIGQFNLFGVNGSSSHNHIFINIERARSYGNMLCANGFSHSLHIRNSTMGFYSSTTYRSSISNTKDGLFVEYASSINTSYLWCSTCFRGAVIIGSKAGNDNHRFGASNNEYVGLEVGYGSLYESSWNADSSCLFNGNGSVGSWTIGNSMAIFSRIRSEYNHIGISSSDNSIVMLEFVKLFTSVISNNLNHGCVVANSATLDISDSTISNNGEWGIYVYNSSNIVSSGYTTGTNITIQNNDAGGIYGSRNSAIFLMGFYISDNGDSGIAGASVLMHLVEGTITRCNSNSSIYTSALGVHSGAGMNSYNVNISGNYQTGVIVGWGCYSNIHNCDINENSLDGMTIGSNASCYFSGSECLSNGANGIYLSNSSLGIYAWDDLNLHMKIQGNGSHGIRCVLNSRVSINEDDTGGQKVFISGNTNENLSAGSGGSIVDSTIAGINNTSPPINQAPVDGPDGNGNYSVKNNGASIIRA